jgi:glycolate oxidase iron-sulfur subunit
MNMPDIKPESVPTGRGIFTPELLDRCISWGFSLPACPTYALTGVETSSPRGRINLMRALETGVLADDDPTVLEESSFCLGCRACEEVCPAGVQYGELLEEWRDHLWHGRRRPVQLWPLLWAVDSPRRVRAMGTVRRHAGRGSEAPGPVNLMLGCFERVLYPRVNRVARKLAPELTAPAAQGCCGALHAHNGELERGKELAKGARRGASRDDRDDVRRVRRTPGGRPRPRASQGVLAMDGRARALPSFHAPEAEP